jgi:hypothetical protein
MNADQLRQAMAKLPEPVTDKKPPHWEFWRRQLWQLAQDDNPINFMGWPCVYHTMLVNHWSMTAEWDYVVKTDTARWPKVIMPHTGYPTDYFMGTPYSNNMINQAYHVALWESTTGKRIDQLDTIIEFGGGYGAMALLCWRLGFRGKYIIFDLPEFSLLQQWFLSQEGVENVAWPKKVRATEADLLIALYSLSETPTELRDNFLEKVGAKSYLFLYSPTWEGYNNEAYFNLFARDIDDLKWHSQLTPRQTDSYLIGW